MADPSFGESVVSFHSNIWSSVSLMVTFWAPVEAATSARAAPPWAVTLVSSVFARAYVIWKPSSSASRSGRVCTVKLPVNVRLTAWAVPPVGCG